MAKGKLDTRTDMNWILRGRKVIDGLDHLGIELVSVNLYQAMPPGLTNVTERARYFAFYPWTIHRYAHEGPRVRTKAAWRTWGYRRNPPHPKLGMRGVVQKTQL